MRKVIIVILAVIFSTNMQAQETSTSNNSFKNKLTPQAVDYVDTAPHTLELTDTIAAPISKVWELISVSKSWVKWFPDVTYCEELNTNAEDHKTRVLHGDGNKFLEEIILWEPNKAYGFTVLECNKKIARSFVELVYLEPIDENRTRITYKGGAEWRGVAKLLAKTANKTTLRKWKEGFENIEKLINQ